MLRCGFSTMTGSSAAVSGCTSIPLALSRPPCGLSNENFRESLSSSLRSIGDQPPAILPAMMPTIAAAGPNPELERERVRRCFFSGEIGEGGGLSLGVVASATGVCGRKSEFDLDLDILRDLGINASRGCWILYARADILPPRIFLRKVRSSLISSIPGFHSPTLVSSSSKTNSGPLSLPDHLGNVARMSSSGMQRITIATGMESTPNTIE